MKFHYMKCKFHYISLFLVFQQLFPKWKKVEKSDQFQGSIFFVCVYPQGYFFICLFNIYTVQFNVVFLVAAVIVCYGQFVRVCFVLSFKDLGYFILYFILMDYFIFLVFQSSYFLVSWFVIVVRLCFCYCFFINN